MIATYPDRAAVEMSDTNVLGAGVAAIGVAVAAYFGFRGKRDPAKSDERKAELLTDRMLIRVLMKRIDSVEDDAKKERESRDQDRIAYSAQLDMIRNQYTVELADKTKKISELEQKVAKLEGQQINAEQLRDQIIAADARAGNWELKWKAARDTIHTQAQDLQIAISQRNLLEKLAIALQTRLNNELEIQNKPPQFDTPLIPDLSLVIKPPATP